MLFRRKHKKPGNGGSTAAPGAGKILSARTTHEVSDRDILNRLASQASKIPQQHFDGARQSVIEGQHVAGDGGNERPVQDHGHAAGEAGEAGEGNAFIRQDKNSSAEDENTGHDTGAGNVQRASPAVRFWRRLRGMTTALAGLAVFAGCLFLVYQGSIAIYNWMHTSDTFVTRHIDITGNVRLSRDVLLRLAGIKEGDNVFSLSVTEMERRLRETPWVEDVSVQRLLPDRFVLRIHERMPSFWVRIQDKLYYANEKGEPIAPVESSNFMSLPLLRVDPGCEDALPFLVRIWRDLRSGTLPVEPGAVATVDVTPSNGIDVFFEDREMRLSISPDDWEGNLTRIGMTFGDLARRRELSRVREIRASGGRVWVVLRSAAQ